ncbi:MAG TPA: hypothetical protein PK655_03365 [archaeon]|jgi:hypothetical protein|nr:hypothetical protein [archaeon]HPV66462.1 hypothetical protein [archaeon]
MILKDTKKIFLWIFGLIFSGIVYFILKNNYIFDTSKHPYIPLAISLVVFLLFFGVGIFVSQISNIFYLVLSKSKDLNEVQKIARDEQKEKQLKQITKNIRRIVNYILFKNYSKESIKALSDYIGLDSEATERLIKIIKETTKIRFVYWIIGIILSSLNMVLIYSLDIFVFLRTPMIIPVTVSLVIYMLFFVEGFLILRLPKHVYLDVLKITEKSKEERKYALEKNKEELNKKESIQKKSIQNIRNTIKYLIEIGANRDWILDLLVSNGFSKEVAQDIMFDIIKEGIKEKELYKAEIREIKNMQKTKELFVKKMLEDFNNLRKIYQEVSYLKNFVSNLEDKEVKVDSFREKQVSYKTFDIPNIKQTEEMSASINEMKKRRDYANIPVDATNGSRITAQEAMASLPKNESSNQDINFLYVLIRPYANKYTREELQSMMLSLGYSVAMIDDVLILLEQNGIDFKQDEKGVFTFVGNIIDKASKK